jgi:hypothetical protein
MKTIIIIKLPYYPDFQPLYVYSKYPLKTKFLLFMNDKYRYVNSV